MQGRRQVKYKKVILMERLSGHFSSVFFLVLLAILLAGQACTSKRLVKQARNLENEGFYEMAAENYFRSLRSNPGNIEAATGLRRTAQRTIDSKASVVNQAYFSGNDRETVYKYLDMLSYQERIGGTGVEILIPSQTLSFYEESKPRFLDRSFEEARLLLEEENFSQAESIFSEIKRIDPLYQDVDRFMRISSNEPVYRKGTEQLNSGLFRSAYQTFTSLLENHGAYKDAKELRDDALLKGMLTIAVGDFDNRSGSRSAHISLRNRIISEIINLGNPFIRVVDDRNTEVFLKEQVLAAGLGKEMKIGQLKAARALLTGSLTGFDIREGRLMRSEKKAFLKEEITIEDSATGEKTTEIVYHKVTYHEYRRENRASGSFQYQLSSTETGVVLVSGVIDLNPADQVHYATFEGNPKDLVPGYWEYSDRNSARDNIQDDAVNIKNLQGLFSARQTIKTAEILQKELTGGLAVAVSRAINEYNPEQ